MTKLKALVVDDTIIYRKILTQAIEDTGLCVVDKTAPNGMIALEWLQQKPFDVVLLDVFMPVMDGIEALKQIKKEFPAMAVIMISSDGEDSVQNTVKALELGAMEFIMKPSGGDQTKNIQSITRTLKILFAQIHMHKYEKGNIDKRKTSIMDADKKTNHNIKKAERKQAYIPYSLNKRIKPDIILIASSTGGPVALESIFKKIEEPINKPVLIVQHMPKHFTKVLANSLKSKSGLNISEVEDKQEISSKEVIIAAGGSHMIVVSEKGKKTLRLLETPMVNGVRPSADVLFKSVAKEFNGYKILVVILTGMGNDGMRGVQELKKRCEVYCISQSEESSVVYGMPRSIEEAGLSDEVLHLNDIPERIVNMLK
ncbi:chemotaxis-specific protein-glutamate methyltransferase CheB [Tindallia californiensis]|uniref:Protein-glutamate methylesterase/protein-glutamine glutaminase n=1 Tax=Tindallia californiensis TaxID=159292 RepID=A0A1H3I513_9FIRM|nr:chemotaxis-specific protein-glutamate methyltransferase CheB [Tindallia californiensis]SDY22722.1 two-component system, chemotaxis family, response regulator CheB [Tindallia californiensis]